MSAKSRISMSKQTWAWRESCFFLAQMCDCVKVALSGLRLLLLLVFFFNVEKGVGLHEWPRPS